jgi:hypothetical protein
MSNKIKSAIKWGLIGSVSSAILGLIFYIFGVDTDSSLKYLSFAIMIGVILAGCYEFRDKISGGFASFKSLFGYTMIIVLVYGVISSIWAVIYMEIIDTNLVKEILLKTELDMEASGADDKIIKQTIEVTKTMMKPHFFFLTSILSMLFIGLIISLPTCAFLKKVKPVDLIIEEKLAE